MKNKVKHTVCSSYQCKYHLRKIVLRVTNKYSLCERFDANFFILATKEHGPMRIC